MAFSFGSITVEELPAQRVASFRKISENPEEECSQAATEWMKKHEQRSEKRRGFGFDIMVSPAEQAKGFRGYEYGYSVPDDLKIDDGAMERTFGGGTYAVMRVVNAFEKPFEAIPGGWQHLNEWVGKNTEWEMAWVLCYEEVVPGNQGNDLILYLPLARRK